jgi:short-subunit dehydrogenase
LRKRSLSEPICAELAEIGAIAAAVTPAFPVDMLINCAGTTVLQSFVETEVLDFSRVLNVNTLAPMMLAQAVVRDWIERGIKGLIVIVSSDAARRGLPTTPPTALPRRGSMRSRASWR